MNTKYKSKLEQTFANTFKNSILGYELNRFDYTIAHKYNPDFKIATNVYFETKGLFDSADRTKIKTVLEQNPGLTIVMVFQNPKLKINKGSKTTYADWCDKHNITWYSCVDTNGIQKEINKHT